MRAFGVSASRGDSHLSSIPKALRAAGPLDGCSRRYIALKRCANVLETVSFSGRHLSVMTGWSRQSRSTFAIALRLTIVAR